MIKNLSIICFLIFISCGDEKKSNNDPIPKSVEVEEKDLGLMKDGNSWEEYKNGDIVFIHSKSNLSSPISLATESNYTHCAVYWCFKGTGPAFYEAASEVEITDFDEFLKHRKGSLLLVMRLKDRDKLLDSTNLSLLIDKMSSWHERPYDGHFLWSDDEIYCSELVYKAYEAVNIKLCELKKLEDFDLSSPQVKKELDKRYGNKIPLKEPIIAPVDLIYSPLLDTIFYSE